MSSFEHIKILTYENFKHPAPQIDRLNLFFKDTYENVCF